VSQWRRHFPDPVGHSLDQTSRSLHQSLQQQQWTDFGNLARQVLHTSQQYVSQDDCNAMGAQMMGLLGDDVLFDPELYQALFRGFLCHPPPGGGKGDDGGKGEGGEGGGKGGRRPWGADASVPEPDLEQYYPIRAESWLTHTTSAPWPPSPSEAPHDDVAGLPTDSHRRGTAVVQSDDLVTDIRHLAGPPNLADEPLQITGKDDPQSIGWSGYRDAKRDVFLSFAGWNHDDRREQGGDLGYLYDAFSELASALDHRLAWRPLSGRDNRPSFAHEQPPSPAVYCEIDWAGVHPRTGLRRGHPDFGTHLLEDLDNYVQVTYYYLYAARAPLAHPPQTDVLPMEGQWAAVSFFLPAKVGEQRDENGRPVVVDLVDTNPEWVVFSYDYRNGHPLAQAYAADDPA